MDWQIYFRQFPAEDTIMHAFVYLDEAAFLDTKALTIVKNEPPRPRQDHITL